MPLIVCTARNRPPTGSGDAHVRHHDVHRDEVRLELPILLDRLGTGFRLTDDLESGLPQDVADHRAHENGVVTDENRVAHCSLLRKSEPGPTAPRDPIR